MRISTLICWAISLVAIGLAVAILAGWPAKADDESALAGELVVEHIAATPARAGETTRVTFTIRNDGSEQALVTGVAFPGGEPSRVIGFLGGSHSAAIGTLAVAPGEEVRLGRRVAWIEVGPLKSDLTLGSLVPARLLLGRGALPLPVHVSAPVADRAQLPGSAPVAARPTGG